MKKIKNEQKEKTFQIPALKLPVCVNCTKALKHESDFCQRIRVCRDCLRAHSIIETALNAAADAKVQAAARERFMQRLLSLDK